jgi:hypothetical protein
VSPAADTANEQPGIARESVSEVDGVAITDANRIQGTARSADSVMTYLQASSGIDDVNRRLDPGRIPVETRPRTEEDESATANVTLNAEIWGKTPIGAGVSARTKPKALVVRYIPLAFAIKKRQRAPARGGL